MATEFCQKCKQAHPGRICDYDDKGECGETLDPGVSGDPKPAENMAVAKDDLSSDVEEGHTKG